MLQTILVLALTWLGLTAAHCSQLAPAADTATLTRWVGDWTGEGKFFGQPATQYLKWERVLEGKFLRLSLRVEAAGKTLFEGHAYYQQTEAVHYEARWFDAQGHSYPIKARLDADTLTAFWGEPSKEEGKSTYRLLEAGKRLEVVDAIHNKDGSWREFWRFMLKPAHQSYFR
jgi:hypothetical protein